WMKEMASPPSAQPKQYQRLRAGVTLNDGDFSSWNGHRPFSDPPPALRSWRYSPTTSAIGDRSRTSAMSSSRIRPATSVSLPTHRGLRRRTAQVRHHLVDHQRAHRDSRPGPVRARPPFPPNPADRRTAAPADSHAAPDRQVIRARIVLNAAGG